MKISLFVLSIAALAAAVAVGSAVLAALVGFLLIVVTFIFMREAAEFRRKLAKILGSDRRFASAETDALLQAAEYRIHSLEWQAQNGLKVQRQITRSELLQQITWSLEGAAGPGNDDTWEALLDLIVQYFRCDAAAVALGTTKIVSRGVPGSPLEQQILHGLKGYFERGEQSDFGFQDLSRQQGVVCRLADAGFRYGVSFPFTHRVDGEDRRGALWLGYPAAKLPTPFEVSFAEELSGRISGEFASLQQLGQLSSRVREIERSDQQKGEFIAHMSHDIRTPLGNLVAILHLFQIEGVNPQNMELIDIALNNCESLREIVEDILDYTKHSAGALTAHAVAVDAAKIVKEVVESFRATAKMKGLELEFLEPDSPAISHLDKRQLRRIVSNLVSNALKYTPFGKVSVQIETSAPQEFAIHVIDSGVGLSPAQMKHLFTPFRRFQERTADGIGLGLVLTKILIELNKGEIRVVSERERGSKFSVIFPRVEVAADKARANGKLSNVTSVLIVDDDPDCVETLARGLELKQYRVLKATTCLDAMSIANFGKPQIVIADAAMPDGGAEKLLRYFRGQEHSPQVIVLTGRDCSRSEAIFRKLGATHVHLKPVELDELLKCFQDLNSDALLDPGVDRVSQKVR